MQCRPNIQTGPKGACPDDVQGGLSNVTALSGRRESNGRCVEYVRPLSATGECSSSILQVSTGHPIEYHSMRVPKGYPTIVLFVSTWYCISLHYTANALGHAQAYIFSNTCLEFLSSSRGIG